MKITIEEAEWLGDIPEWSNAEQATEALIEAGVRTLRVGHTVLLRFPRFEPNQDIFAGIIGFDRHGPIFESGPQYPFVRVA